MCMGGGGSSKVEPLTQEEMVEMTDNPFQNPVSGEETPSWKLQANTKTKKKNKSKLTTSDNYQG